MGEKGMTPRELAAKAGLSRQAVYAHLSEGIPSSRGIGREAAKKYSQALGVPPEVFLYGESSRAEGDAAHG